MYAQNETAEAVAAKLWRSRKVAQVCLYVVAAALALPVVASSGGPEPARRACSVASVAWHALGGRVLSGKSLLEAGLGGAAEPLGNFGVALACAVCAAAALAAGPGSPSTFASIAFVAAVTLWNLLNSVEELARPEVAAPPELRATTTVALYFTVALFGLAVVGFQYACVPHVEQVKKKKEEARLLEEEREFFKMQRELAEQQEQQQPGQAGAGAGLASGGDGPDHALTKQQRKKKQ
jgi:hypothetical protein